MNKVGMIAVALALSGAASGVSAAEHKLDPASLAPANNVAAVATVKAESGAGFALGGSDVANTQLSSHADDGALSKSAAIGSHAYSVAPDEGSLKQGVLNAKVELSTLAPDPQIGGTSKLGSVNAAQQSDGRDLMK